ncbi:hypothetical protein PDJAM_G00102440 [Pangasius djambal]|uniref:Uncharacterized protein n=1 Tax=Pangasius djambal TaxID=1691987 RepID=A0ACC5Y043_9TELE|nr:hypothetical protein [Pangasius djambal]
MTDDVDLSQTWSLVPAPGATGCRSRSRRALDRSPYRSWERRRAGSRRVRVEGCVVICRRSLTILLRVINYAGCPRALGRRRRAATIWRHPQFLPGSLGIFSSNTPERICVREPAVLDGF